jgi:hypothetical protein
MCAQVEREQRNCKEVAGVQTSLKSAEEDKVAQCSYASSVLSLLLLLPAAIALTYWCLYHPLQSALEVFVVMELEFSSSPEDL